MFRVIFIFSFIFYQSIPGQSVEKKILIQIYENAPEELKKLEDLYFERIWPRHEKYVYAIVSESDLTQIKERGFGIEIITTINQENLVDDEYHTYDEMRTVMDSLAGAFPNISHQTIIGTSQWRHLEIPALKISDNPEIEEDEPAVLFDGQHHAREPVGMETCLALMRFLLINYGVDEAVTNWVDQLEIWIVPMLNPDGWQHIIEEQDVDYLWRKNQRDNDNNLQFNFAQDGVDLNRNYDYQWDGGNTDNTSTVYRGPSFFSEGETQAKRDLALTQKFVFSITYHSFGQYVLYPQEVNGDFFNETDFYQTLSDSVASKILRYGSSDKFYGSFGALVNAGYSDSWMFAVNGTFEFTVETAPEFIPPGSESLQIARDNIPGATYLLERVFGSGLTGLITDASTQAPLSAKIEILELSDEKVIDRTSDTTFGRYFRPLPPDTFTVSVEKDGYEPQILAHVIVNPDTLTILNVALVSFSDDTSEEVFPKELALFPNYPNPFNLSTSIIYSLPKGGEVKIQVINMMGKIVKTLVHDFQNQGKHIVTWNGIDEKWREVGSGLYVVRLVAGQETLNRKMIMMK